MQKPLIGITCNLLPATSWTVSLGIAAHNQDFQGLATDYANMIQKAGGIPVVLPTVEDLEGAEQLWSRLDGLLFSGGHDLNPQIYGQRVQIQCGAVDLARDRYELAAFRYGRAQQIPMLGICRGIQLFNAAMGGTNYQDLPSSGFAAHTLLGFPRNAASHTVTLTPGCLLEEIFGTGVLGVNSFHHQAVCQLAPGLRELARSEDGVIEAVQLVDHPFALAVQWHPEMMYDSPQQLRLAQAFVRACGA